MKLLTIDEVACVLRVRRPRAYELARQGLLPVTRLGRQLRVEDEALATWVRSGGGPLPGVWRPRRQATTSPMLDDVTATAPSDCSGA
jgi:excisionase family DNA binding protein